MNVDRIEKLIRLFGASRSGELVVEAEGWRVSVRRGAHPARPPQQGAHLPLAVDELPLPESEEHLATIPAPLVGIFRQGDPVIRAGDRVTKGQTVGSIESMKILNPIQSVLGGEVVEVLIEDGVPVEFGQHLYRLRPQDEPVGLEGEVWSGSEDGEAGH